MVSMPQRPSLQVLGYVAFGVFALLFSLYRTFPASVVAQRVAQEVQRRSQGRISARFGDVSPYRLSGLDAEDVSVRILRPGAQPVDVSLERVRARVRLLPLVIGRMSLSIDVRSGDGRIAGRVSPGKDGFELDLEAEDVDLASPPVLGQLVDLPVRGVLDGAIEATLPREAQKSVGALTLAIRDARLGPGAVSGFTVPGIDLGTLSTTFELRDGRLRLASFEQQGGDMQLRLTATMTLRPELTRSSLDACVELKSSEAFLSQQPNLRAALQLAEARLRKDAQGFLHMPLSGTIADPRLRGGLCRGSADRKS